MQLVAGSGYQLDNRKLYNFFEKLFVFFFFFLLRAVSLSVQKYFKGRNAALGVRAVSEHALST